MTTSLNSSPAFVLLPAPENLGYNAGRMTRETPPEALRLPRCPGRLRFWRHLALMLPVAAAGWTWFGWSGSVPLLLWWWQRRPRPAATAWHVDLGQVRRARLGPWRLRLFFAEQESLEIFSDELSPCDLARLRRELKYQLATGCSTSKRSGEPGNRMVSSPRASVSGQSRL
jgi:hypothetical protein